MQKTRFILAIATAGVLLGGCGGGGNKNGIPPINTVNPVTSGTLSFAVGTANIYGTATGLNVVSAYRKANGLSNVLVDTPTISGPMSLANVPVGAVGSGGYDPYSTLPGGASQSDINANTFSGTSQTVAINVAPDATNTTTFGQSGGVFVNGLSPGNYTNQGVPFSYKPYAEPIFDAGTQFRTWGGPPAFDPNSDGMGLRDGLSTLGSGVVGIPEGFTVFEGVVVSAGAYNLSLQVPTGFNGPTPTFATVSSSANMGSTGLLPTITAPALTLDGAGGGSFAVAMPAGVTEAYVQIVDTGNGGTNCQGPIGAVAFPVYYTVIVKQSGAYTLPDTDGPNTNVTGGPKGLTPSPSICTAAQNTAANAGTASPGDSYTVQVIGTDYPMYEATYPINKSANPTLAGASGQADITISTQVSGTST